MQKEELDIIVREEKLHGILYIPENNNHPNGSNLLFPLIIHINGMPGTSPEDDEDRFAKNLQNMELLIIAMIIKEFAKVLVSLHIFQHKQILNM